MQVQDPPSARERRWELVVDPEAVALVTGAVTFAEAHIWERDGQVILEFWFDGAEVPSAPVVELVERAFAHPAVQPDARVLACVPRREAGLLEQARRHIQDASTRTVGLTCLLEGRVRAGEPRRSG